MGVFCFDFFFMVGGGGGGGGVYLWIAVAMLQRCLRWGCLAVCAYKL